MKANINAQVFAGIKSGVQLGTWLNYKSYFSAYNSRVLADSGSITSSADSTELYRIFEKYGLVSGLKLLCAAQGGNKTRLSGNEYFVTKTYDFSKNNNDPVQTTSTVQPFLGGRIATNDKYNYKSVTGASLTLNHSAITVTGTYTIIKVLNDENVGKTTVTFTEVSTGSLSSISWVGRLYSYSIFSGTISTEKRNQIKADLLAMFPEIPSVLIGTQRWATLNYEGIKTPQGNLIQNVTANSTWADSTNIYNTTYAATSGTDEQKTYAAVKAAAMWSYYNNDPALGAVYGKVLNDYAIKLLDMDIAYYNTANPTTHWGWVIPTEADWNTLEATVNNDAEALKHAGTTYWSAPNAGTNSSGFTALPAGYRKEDGTFAGLNTTALFGSTDMSVPRIGKSLRLIKR